MNIPLRKVQLGHFVFVQNSQVKEPCVSHVPREVATVSETYVYTTHRGAQLKYHHKDVIAVVSDNHRADAAKRDLRTLANRYDQLIEEASQTIDRLKRERYEAQLEILKVYSFAVNSK